MEFELKLQQRHVVRLIVGIPAGGDTVRARLESDQGDVITLEDGTLAAIVRAYMAVSTHPQTRAVELRATTLPSGKAGFGRHQLVEVPADEARLRHDLAGMGALPAPMDAGTSFDSGLVLDAAEADLGDELEDVSAATGGMDADDLELDDPDTADNTPRAGKKR